MTSYILKLAIAGLLVPHLVLGVRPSDMDQSRPASRDRSKHKTQAQIADALREEKQKKALKDFGTRWSTLRASLLQLGEAAAHAESRLPEQKSSLVQQGSEDPPAEGHDSTPATTDANIEGAPAATTNAGAVSDGAGKDFSVKTKPFSRMSTDRAGKPEEERIWINGHALEYLFNIIDENRHQGVVTKLKKEDWDKAVRGPWADTLWENLKPQDNSTDDISTDAFKANWDRAVLASFKKMGGDDGPIEMSDVEQWECTDSEKEFAKVAFLDNANGKMDQSHFEEFLFTVMWCNAQNALAVPDGAESAGEASARKTQTLYDTLQFLSGLNVWEQREEAHKNGDLTVGGSDSATKSESDDQSGASSMASGAFFVLLLVPFWRSL